MRKAGATNLNSKKTSAGNMNEKRRRILSWSTVFLIAILVVSTPSWLPSLLSPLAKEGMERSWHAMAANANPGSGQCGIVNVLIYPHQSDTSTYDSSLSESNAYAHFDDTPSLNEPLEGSVPYNTAFDIVVVAQFNYTVAYNTSSNSWDKDYVKCLITCSDLGISADTEMLEGDFYDITGNSEGDTAKINFYINNAGNGYQISHGETVNITEINIYGYY